jgi:integrase
MRYRVAKHRRGFVCVIYEPSGNRRRIALKASDKFGATAEAAELVGHIEQRKPRQRLTVGQIVEMYLEQSEAIWKDVERHHWKSASGTFGGLAAVDVTEAVCRKFAGDNKRKVGTIRKALSILRAALNWAERKALIDKAPHIWLPPAPPPKDRRLTREEFDRLAAATGSSHQYVFIQLARYTAARSGAILGLTWDRVSFDQRRIAFAGSSKQKPRAIVPMHPELAWILVLAKEAAMTGHVIEWAGEPVKSIKRGFRQTVIRAGLDKSVTPHTLRHTAASWMAEAGVPMSEIAAVLGHRDSRTTERVYAKYSPEYLQRAVRALG